MTFFRPSSPATSTLITTLFLAQNLPSTSSGWTISFNDIQITFWRKFRTQIALVVAKWVRQTSGQMAHQAYTPLHTRQHLPEAMYSQIHHKRVQQSIGPALLPSDCHRQHHPGGKKWQGRAQGVATFQEAFFVYHTLEYPPSIHRCSIVSLGVQSEGWVSYSLKDFSIRLETSAVLCDRRYGGDASVYSTTMWFL